MIWLARIPLLVVLLLIGNLAAAFKWAEFRGDLELDWRVFFEFGHGIGTIIWFIAVSVSVLALVPAMIAVILAHRRQIGSLWTFAYAGAAINSGAYYVLKGIVMRTLGPVAYPHPVPELLCMAGAGLFAGVVYWLLAGRKRAPSATTA